MNRREVLAFMKKRHHKFTEVITKEEVFVESSGTTLYLSPHLLTMGEEPLKKVSLLIHGMHEEDEIEELRRAVTSGGLPGDWTLSKINRHIERTEAEFKRLLRDRAAERGGYIGVAYVTNNQRSLCNRTLNKRTKVQENARAHRIYLEADYSIIDDLVTLIGGVNALDRETREAKRSLKRFARIHLGKFKLCKEQNKHWLGSKTTYEVYPGI